jgi:hypothetical protein
MSYVTLVRSEGGHSWRATDSDSDGDLSEPNYLSYSHNIYRLVKHSDMEKNTPGFKYRIVDRSPTERAKNRFQGFCSPNIPVFALLIVLKKRSLCSVTVRWNYVAITCCLKY